MRVLLAVTALLALTACETTKGAGRDLQKAGSALTGTAQDAQQSMRSPDQPATSTAQRQPPQSDVITPPQFADI